MRLTSLQITPRAVQQPSQTQTVLLRHRPHTPNPAQLLRRFFALPRVGEVRAMRRVREMISQHSLIL